MADYDWPADLVPFAQSFYLQPHSGGSESPFSRVTKVYELSAPRWICRMSFRGGHWGQSGPEALGPRLDAMIARLHGRRHRVRLHDFRRPAMRATGWTSAAGNLAAAAGAATMALTGLRPGMLSVLAGDYVGGDGRPHIVLDDVVAGTDGTGTLTFEPPLAAAVAAGAALFGKPTGLFRLTGDDAGTNPAEVAAAISYDLEFVEDL